MYNTDFHTYQFCNGSNWVKFGGGSRVTMPTSSDGYFVMSKSTWNGNLGGSLAAADAKCLTELTTNTGWRGYPDANSRGILTSGKVHAFICAHEAAGICNATVASTTYYFAYAGDATKGGASFTTDSGGIGPNDSADWSDAHPFRQYI